ncbi:DUF1565 domain-containing protein [bacterium]|nr:DUF1565 domain-containing protein [candidate division CSSED10-310 bacterium]
MKSIMFLLSLFFSVSVYASVIHVPSDQSTIQAGIDAALDGDTVLVSDGTYTGDGNRDIDFMGKPITVMSETGPEQTIIDCQGSPNDNHRGFVIHRGEDRSSVLEGFTVINGYINHNSGVYAHGGGIYCVGSSPAIRQCNLCDNYAEYGGGIHLWEDCTPLIEDCIVEGNTAVTGGGGILFVYDSAPEILRCTIANNISGYEGGGIVAAGGTTGLITESTITGNYSCTYGGGIFFIGSQTLITRSTVAGNRSNHVGGGVCCYQSGPVIGGSEECGNRFEDNMADYGYDLFALNIPDGVINSQYNSFKGGYWSDVFVSPQDYFDLNFCESDMSDITQNVYVKPDGNDNNDGLSWDTAFKTITYASKVIRATETNPLTIFVASGTYSPSQTGEQFPIQLVQYVTLQGDHQSTTLLDAEQTKRGLMGYNSSHATVKNVTVTGGNADLGAGAYIRTASGIVFDRVTFSENHASGAGGGIYSEGTNTFHLSRCTISNNIACNGAGVYVIRGNPRFTNSTLSGNVASYNGGGFYLYDSDAYITNCLVTNNDGGWDGGGILCNESHPILLNCTFSLNNYYALAAPYCSPHLTNCILWNDFGEVYAASDPPTHSRVPIITYSLIEGGYSGSGNIDADPMFVAGCYGDYFLSQTLSGQETDSPCIDHGSDLAENIRFNSGSGEMGMDQTTTRTDLLPDSDRVDMGFHYFSPYGATPTPDHSKPTPPLAPVGVDLVLSQTIFAPGDHFLLEIIFHNPGPDIYPHQPYVVLLDVFGDYYWYPGWTRNFDVEIFTIPVGIDRHEILNFIWPNIEGQTSGLVFVAAILTEDFLQIIGEWDAVYFGWEQGD